MFLLRRRQHGPACLLFPEETPPCTHTALLESAVARKRSGAKLLLKRSTARKVALGSVSNCATQQLVPGNRPADLSKVNTLICRMRRSRPPHRATVRSNRHPAKRRGSLCGCCDVRPKERTPVKTQTAVLSKHRRHPGNTDLVLPRSYRAPSTPTDASRLPAKPHTSPLRRHDSCPQFVSEETEAERS